MAGAVEGLKVIEMGQVAAAPAAAAVLADWGAEVIKVEPPTGDSLRSLIRLRGVDKLIKIDGGAEMQVSFLCFNRNKKSVVVNLTKEGASDIIYKLVEKSDVFITNYSLDVLKRFNLDYATLSQFNPGLVYAILTGYGRKGPDKDQRGYDYSAFWAHSGFQYLIGEPGSDPPPQRGGLGDHVAAMHMVAGIMAALYHKQKTGIGQELEFSLYQSGVWTLSVDNQDALYGLPIIKTDRKSAHNPLFNSYCTRDGKWVFLAMLQSDPFWVPFCRAIGRPELEDSPKFNSLMAREQNRDELCHLIDEVMASADLKEWETRFVEHDIIYARILSPAEIVTDPHALVNDFFVEVEHPSGGRVKVVASPVKFGKTPATVRSVAPEVGQHTEEVLLELGYSWEDIGRLKEQQVI